MFLYSGCDWRELASGTGLCMWSWGSRLLAHSTGPGLLPAQHASIPCSVCDEQLLPEEPQCGGRLQLSGYSHNHHKGSKWVRFLNQHPSHTDILKTCCFCNLQPWSSIIRSVYLDCSLYKLVWKFNPRTFLMFSTTTLWWLCRLCKLYLPIQVCTSAESLQELISQRASPSYQISI